MNKAAALSNSQFKFPASAFAGMDFSGFIGVSPAAQKVRELAAIFAADPLGECVLITGERGVGKDVIAGEIHKNSRCLKRKDIFVEVNCGAMHEETLHSILFGHRKGSFTGAIDHHEGYFTEARGGSLFLNEIGYMPLTIQPRLHRVIEYQKYRPLGGKCDESSDARLICATNRDLRQMCRDKEFMPDLLDRLKRRHIHIPPLRERKEDIRVLSVYLAGKYTKCYKMNGSISIAPEVFRILEDHDFPGNVRELDCIFSMAFLELFLMNKKTLTPEHIYLEHPEITLISHYDALSDSDIENRLKELILVYVNDHRHLWEGKPSQEVSCLLNLKEFECNAIRDIYKIANHNKAVTARIVGLTVDELRKWKCDERFA
jgi:two-component system, NtrC family, response regulator